MNKTEATVTPVVADGPVSGIRYRVMFSCCAGGTEGVVIGGDNLNSLIAKHQHSFPNRDRVTRQRKEIRRFLINYGYEPITSTLDDGDGAYRQVCRGPLGEVALIWNPKPTD